MSDFPVIRALLASNKAWAESVDAKDPNFFPDSAKNPQRPQVLWLGCSDSRVPESVVLAAKPGDIFVHRNIGNQVPLADDNAQSVVTYAISEHVQAQHVIVVGHTHCGACKASLEFAEQDPLQDDCITRFLRELIELAKSPHITESPEPVQALVEANIKHQVQNVIASPAIQAAWKAGKEVYVHGFLYRLETGRLEDMHLTQGPQ